MLTKKYYEMIADALNGDAAHGSQNAYGRHGADYSRMTQWERGAYDQWNTTVLSLSHVLAADNPKFDRARFLKACGVAS